MFKGLNGYNISCELERVEICSPNNWKLQENAYKKTWLQSTTSCNHCDLGGPTPPHTISLINLTFDTHIQLNLLYKEA